MEVHHLATITLLLFISMRVTSSAILIASPPTNNKTTPTDREDHAHDLGVAEGAFDPDYFDHFSDLPYFPEFGEIFRLSRTTTPPPPFGPAPFYPVGGRRQRPASSRTKLSKHHRHQSEQQPKQPASRAKKGGPPSKARSFPKIFRFTSDRVNLADFDSRKKANENYLSLSKGDELDSEKVKRNGFLILHGGVFEIGGSKGRPLVATAATHRQVAAETTPSDFRSNSYEEDSGELESARYFYKT